MRIAIVGATGTAGRPTVAAARAAGHDVIPLSRATGVDIRTGAGLAEGIRGADVVIDTSNPDPGGPESSLIDCYAAATRRLAEAAQAEGVGRVVHLSICSIDAPELAPVEYYRAKRAQEEVLADYPQLQAVVRSAQWMEFVMNPFATREGENVVEVEDWLIQPVAVSAVAEVLVEAAAGSQERREVAGPTPIRLPELTQLFLDATGDARRIITSAPEPVALANGLLLAPEAASLLGPTPTQWADALAAQR